MAGTRRVPGRFRRTLRKELDPWVAEGIVSREAADAIAERYGLAGLRPPEVGELPEESTGLAVYSIYILGALLVGGGVISFVAYHWEAIPAAVKLVVAVGAMLAAHAGGYYLWKVTGKRELLGHALIVLGTLTFGANIGLVAQIFHIRSGSFNALAAWSIGALAVAWAVGSVPNAFISVVASFIWACASTAYSPESFCWYPFLLAAGYLPFVYLKRSRLLFTMTLLASFAWFCVWTAFHPHASSWYPFFAAAAFFPFAYLRRSAAAFVLALMAVGISVVVCAGADAGEAWPVAFAAVGAASLCFSLGLSCRGRETSDSFAAPSMVLGTAVAAALAYGFSFRGAAREFVTYGFGLPLGGWLWLLPAAAVYLVSKATWWSGLRSSVCDRTIRPVTAGVLAALVTLLAGLLVGLLAESHVVLVVAAIVACLALAGGLVWGGALLRSRSAIWAGVLLAAFTIMSRFFEYRTGLLVKSLAFTVSGAALIYVGLRIESFLTRNAGLHHGDTESTENGESNRR